MAKAKRYIPVVVERISRSILILRSHRVILDAELAALYGATTKRLNEQVKRNTERFPDDFMFRLTRTETEALNRSAISCAKPLIACTASVKATVAPSAPKLRSESSSRLCPTIART